MNTVTKAALAVLVMAGAFCAGYFLRKPQTIVETKTQVQEVEKVVTKIVKEKVTTPDGTTTEKTTTEIKKDSKAKTSDKHPSQPLPTLLAARTRYSLALTWKPRIDVDAYKPTGVEFGRRLWDTNAWATAGFDWRDRSVLLGLRVEF